MKRTTTSPTLVTANVRSTARLAWAALVLASSTTLLIGCTAADSSEKAAMVVNGRDANEVRHQAVAQLLFCWTTSEDCGSCSGALIAENKILTAAHCILSLDTNRSEFVGATRGYALFEFETATGLEAFEKRGIQVVQADIHREHDLMRNGHFGDLAVLTLERSVPDIEPLPVIAPEQRLAVGDEVEFVGYGLNEIGGEVKNRKWGTNQVAEVCSHEQVRPKSEVSDFVDTADVVWNPDVRDEALFPPTKTYCPATFFSREQQTYRSLIRADRFTIRGDFRVGGDSSASKGDSGGPVLVQRGGGWAIAGVVSSAGANPLGLYDGEYQSVDSSLLQNLRPVITWPVFTANSGADPCQGVTSPVGRACVVANDQHYVCLSRPDHPSCAVQVNSCFDVQVSSLTSAASTLEEAMTNCDRECRDVQVGGHLWNGEWDGSKSYEGNPFMGRCFCTSAVESDRDKARRYLTDGVCE